MKTESEILKEAADNAEMLDIVNRDVFNRIFSAFGHERPFHQNPATYDALQKPIIE